MRPFFERDAAVPVPGDLGAVAWDPFSQRPPSEGTPQGTQQSDRDETTNPVPRTPGPEIRLIRIG